MCVTFTHCVIQPVDDDGDNGQKSPSQAMAPPLAATGKAGKDAHSEETSSLGARAFGVLANYVAAEVADENERLGRKVKAPRR